jgi:hypothetical protein
MIPRNPFRPSRRTFFRGLTLGAAGSVLPPMLERIALSADGKPAPTRFLFVVEGNGVPPQQIQPVGLPFVPREKRDKAAVHPLGKLGLPPALKPVDEFRDRLAIVHGLSGRMCAGGHSSDHGALGAYHANNGRNIQGPTVDGVLGRGRPAIFPNLVLGISADADATVIFNCSADAARRSLPTLCRPDLACERLFGSVAEGKARAGFAAKRNLLDHMAGDIRRARDKIGSVDREKLDAYLSAFENLRDTSARLVEVRDRLKAAAPVPDDKFRSAVETDRLDAHFELAAAAMIAGLTRTATIASGVGFPHFSVTFTGLGVEMAKHPLGHALYNEDNREAWAISEKIRAFHFGLIARFLRRLQAVPEGGGTMLDNTVVVYLSDGAETHHSRCHEWPMVVIGNAGGKLKADGRCIVLPDYGRPGHRTINTLYNTLLHAAGTPVDDFAMLDPHLDKDMHRGPLSELLA